MKRFAVPARAVVLIVAALALGVLALTFALTGRATPDVSAPPAAAQAGSPTPAATSPAAGPVPRTPAAPRPRATTAEPGEDPAEPTATPAADASAVETATAFAAAWLNAEDPQWAAKLTAMSTPDLGAAWSQADPATVPAGRVGDSRTIRGQLVSAALADVAIPVVTAKGGPVGLLTVELTLTGGVWLVSDVDWTRA